MAGKLYTRARLPGLGSLAARLAVLVAILAVTVLVLYFEGGLVDSRYAGDGSGGRPHLKDCVYFAMVTITTVGYGDIVPTTTTSRMVDAFFLTPIRLIVLFIFLGTAYQLVLKRFQEEYRMKRAVGKLDGHVIVCGFGATGRAAVKELLLQGTPPDQLVVIENDEDALREAAELNVVVVQGDASRESVLKSVAVERAAHVIVCSGRDDAAVLIALTARDLNPKAQLIATCREQENVKLLQRSGVHITVSPSAAGGNLMAAATRRTHLVETMQDMLSVGGAIQLDERPVRRDEVGKTPSAIRGLAILRVYRGERHFDLGALPALQDGDTIVYAAAAIRCTS